MPAKTPGTAPKATVPGESLKLSEEVTSVESPTITRFDDDVAVEPWRHRAETARRLAYFLCALLAFSFLCHFTGAAIVVIYGKPETAAIFKDVFTLWLPVIAALASSAVTYYFTKQK
jgi:hypothetical protein